MPSTSMDQFMRQLLEQQTEMIRKAITDLQGVREDLPAPRRSEVDAIIGRLQAALTEDREALSLIATPR